LDICEHGASVHADPIMRDMARYGLAHHALELEAYGVTIVPPEKTQSGDGFLNRLRDAIVRTYEKRGDVVVGDIATATSVPSADYPLYLVEEDDVFVEAATNPAALTLVRWLLGQSAMLDTQAAMLKAQGSASPYMHIDAVGIPPGPSSFAHMCNVSWLCTDYESIEDGPTTFVLGSHKFGRAPLAHETDVNSTPYKTVPLIGKAGSFAVWHGMTWHGAAARTKPGLRVTLGQTFARSYLRTSVDYGAHVPPELLEKYPEFKRIIGNPLYPFRDPKITDMERIAWAKAPEADVFA
jgi:hypothetical protein